MGIMENFHQRSRSAPVVDKQLLHPFQQPLGVYDKQLPDSFNNNSNPPLNTTSFAPLVNQPSLHGNKQSFGNKIKKFLSKNNRDFKRNESNEARSVSGYENFNRNNAGNNTLDVTVYNNAKHSRTLRDCDETMYSKNKKLTIYNFLNTSFKRKTIPVKMQKDPADKEVKGNSLKNIRKKFYSSSKPEIFDEGGEKANLSKTNASSYNNIVENSQSNNHKKVLYTKKYKNDYNNNKAKINITTTEYDTDNTKNPIKNGFDIGNDAENVEFNNTTMVLNLTSNYETIDKISRHNQINKYINSFNDNSRQNHGEKHKGVKRGDKSHNFIYKSKSQNVILEEDVNKEKNDYSFKNLADLKNKNILIHSSLENKIDRNAKVVDNEQITRRTSNKQFFKSVDDDNDDKNYFYNNNNIMINNNKNNNVNTKNNNLNNINNNATTKDKNVISRMNIVSHDNRGRLFTEIGLRENEENRKSLDGNLKKEIEKLNSLAYEKMCISQNNNRNINKNNIIIKNNKNIDCKNNNFLISNHIKNKNNNKNNLKPPPGPLSTKLRNSIFGKFNPDHHPHLDSHHHHDLLHHHPHPHPHHLLHHHHQPHHHHHHGNDNRPLHNKTMTSFMLVGSRKNNDNNNSKDNNNNNNGHHKNKNKNKNNNNIKIIKNNDLSYIEKKRLKENFSTHNRIINPRSWYDFDESNYEMKQEESNRNTQLDKHSMKSLHTTFGCFSINNKDNGKENVRNNVDNLFDNRNSILMRESFNVKKMNYENKENCERRKLSNFSFKLMNTKTFANQTSLKNNINNFNNINDNSTPTHPHNQTFDVENTITKHNINKATDIFTETPRSLYNDINNDTFTINNTFTKNKPLTNNTFTKGDTFTPSALRNRTFTPNSLKNNTFTHNSTFTHNNNNLTHNNTLPHENTPDIYKTPLNTFQNISWDTLVSTFNLGNVKANNTCHMTGKVCHSMVKAAVKRKMIEDMRDMRKMKCRRRLFDEDSNENRAMIMNENSKNYDGSTNSTNFKNVETFKNDSLDWEDSQVKPSILKSSKKLFSYDTSQRLPGDVEEGGDVEQNTSLDENRYINLGVFPLGAKIPDLLQVPSKNNNKRNNNINNKNNNDNNNINNCENGCLNGCDEECVNTTYKDLLRKAYLFKNDNLLNTDIRWSQISENYV